LIESIVSVHFADLVRLCASILDNQAEAQDAAQETLIAAIKNLRNFRGDSALKTWLFSIGINTCRGRLRKRKSRQRIQTLLERLHWVEPPHPPLPENQLIQRENKVAIWQAVDQLDEKHRLPIILRYVHELSTAEIAETLQIQEGTVHSRLHYARKRLKSLLAETSGAILAERRGTQ
jgi:RNA polymerase sigma-70 factor (ECF subfamily)